MMVLNMAEWVFKHSVSSYQAIIHKSYSMINLLEWIKRSWYWLQQTSWCQRICFIRRCRLLSVNCCDTGYNNERYQLMCTRRTWFILVRQHFYFYTILLTIRVWNVSAYWSGDGEMWGYHVLYTTCTMPVMLLDEPHYAVFQPETYWFNTVKTCWWLEF